MQTMTIKLKSLKGATSSSLKKTHLRLTQAHSFFSLVQIMDTAIDFQDMK